MTQDEIRYLNMDADHLGGWCWNSPFKSLGNVIHWIKVYSTLHIAESITVGSDSVNLYGEKIADIEWDEELKMPIFKWTLDFLEDHEWVANQQDLYLRMAKVDHSELSEEFRERWAMYDVLREVREAKKI